MKDGQPLSNMAMLNLIGRMNGDRARSGQTRYLDPRQDNADVTPHGFRSTFRDWAAERTNFPTEVVDMALAHAIDGEVEAAYRRGDLFDKRRRLMDTSAELRKARAGGHGGHATDRLKDTEERLIARRPSYGLGPSSLWVY